MNRHLWPLHLKPCTDELLSSWIVRLSRAYGAGTERWCQAVWRHGAFWDRDIDKGIYESILNVLAEKTATPLARVFDTTIRGYSGFPEHELYPNGLSPWVLSIGLHQGRRQRCWLQYCPYCLNDDQVPYFRRCWRLAFVTVCLVHRCRLLERCMICGAPCNLYQLSSDAESLTQCHRCRFDARRAHAPLLDHTAGHHGVMQLQRWLIEALQTGRCRLSPSELVPSDEYLLVLQHLGRLLITRKRAKALRTGFCQHLGECYFEPSFPSPRARALEVLPVADRFTLMLLLAWWLDDWPDQFVAMCAMAKLTVTDLRRDFGRQPDWYQQAVEQVARGRFAGMKFARYEVIEPVAATSVKSHSLL